MWLMWVGLIHDKDPSVPLIHFCGMDNVWNFYRNGHFFVDNREFWVAFPKTIIFSSAREEVILFYTGILSWKMTFIVDA